MDLTTRRSLSRRDGEPADPIRFASFLGENGFEFYRQVVAYLGEATGLPTAMVNEPASELGAMLDEARIEAAFGCGLPYVWKAAEDPPSAWLLAAPVMPGERYRDQPIYFADLIVRAGSRFQTFADLRGATFAYNQATSLSGYVLLVHHLLTHGETLEYFSAAVPSGSHAVSMDWVESGRVDTAAIDSVVLEMEVAQRPQRAHMWRVIASLGPAGMPPVIASARVPPRLRGQLREALVGMHRSDAGRAVLRRGGVRRFAPVEDSHYDGIRRMLRAVEQARVLPPR